MYIDNAIEHFGVAKYATVNAKNKRFEKYIAGISGGIEAMKALGFEERGDHFVMNVPTKEELARKRDAFLAAENKANTSAQAQSQAPAATASAAAMNPNVAAMLSHPAIGNMMGNSELNAATNAMMANNPGLIENMMNALAGGGDLQSVMSNPSVQAITQQMMSDPNIMAAAGSILGTANPSTSTDASNADAGAATANSANVPASTDEADFDDDDFMLQEAIRLSMMEEEGGNKEEDGEDKK